MKGRDRNPGPLWVAAFVGFLWGVEFVNLVLGHDLLRLGILPRTLVGLRGIVFAPFLHDGPAHLLANTLPLLVLGSLVLARGLGAFLRVSAFVLLVGGALTWLIGRPSYHVGASGLVFGYFAFLIASAWYERRPLPVLLAVVAILLYGGLFLGLLPLFPGISWEGHIFGFLAGLFAARLDLATERSRPPSP